MIKKIFRQVALCLVLVVTTMGGTAMAAGKTVKGVVVDGKSGEHIEFATVALYTAADHALFSGGITDEKGAFAI